MGDVLFLFLGLACILFFVAVMGHGLWLLMAAIWKAVFRKSDVEVPRDCPACGAARSVRSGRCTVCNSTPLIPGGTSLNDEIAATLRQLNRLVNRKEIPPELRDNLAALLREEVRTAAAPPSAAGPSPSADVTPAPLEPSTDAPVREAPSLAPDPVEPADALFAEGIFAGAVVDAELVDSTAPPIVSESTAATNSPSAPRPAAQALHPLDRPEREVVDRPPRRPLASLLQAFMEEKNIRWGEIISGLLIVISAVGLVISLWATLRDAMPYMPALIFMLGTGAFHAAGHYTLRKWDLRSISRAVLIIGTLLVPLNFLAAIALTGGSESSARDSIPLFVAAVVIGMTAYGVMTWYAGQALLSYGRSLLLVAVLGTCVGQLLVNQVFTQATTDTAVILLLMVPLVAFLFAVVGSLRVGRRWRRLSPNRAQPLLLILGISSFALLAPIGLLVSKAESPDAILAQLSPTVSLVGAAILASGLVLHVRTRSSRLAQLRTTGTAIAFSGGFFLLAAVAMAWPIPLLLLFVGLVNACLLAGMAWVARLPLLHVAAVACGGLAVVIGYHGLVGSYPGWIVDSPSALPESLLTGQTSAVLTGYFLFLLLGVSRLLQRQQATKDAAVYFWSSLAVSVAGIGLAIVVGFLDVPGSDLGVVILTFYACAGIGAGALIGNQRAADIGAGLLLVALVQMFASNDVTNSSLESLGWLPQRPILIAFIAHSLVCAVLAALAGYRDAWDEPERRRDPLWNSLMVPLSRASLLTAVAALPFTLIVREHNFLQHSIYTGLICLALLAVALVHLRFEVFVCFEFVSTVALSFTTTAICHSRAGWNGYFTIGHLRFQVIALGLWAIAWTCLAIRCGESPVYRRLIPARRMSVDQPLLPTLIVGLLLIMAAGCLAGIGAELGLVDVNETLEMRDQSLAFGIPSWVAAIIVVLATLIWLRDSVTALRLGAVTAATATIPLLLAGPFADTVATASALRWTFAFYSLIVLVTLALRRSIQPLSRALFPHVDLKPRDLRDLAMLACVLGIAPVLLLTTLTAAHVATGGGFGGPVAESAFAQMGRTWSIGLPLLLCVAGLLMAAIREGQPWFALAGSLVFQYLATMVCLLPILSSGEPLNVGHLVEVVQWNAVALGIYALVWCSAGRWIERSDDRAASMGGSLGLAIQIVAACLTVVLLAAWSLVEIVVDSRGVNLALAALGQWPSYMALGLTLAAFAAQYSQGIRKYWLSLPSAIMAAAVSFAAATSFTSGGNAPWLEPLHVLVVGWTLIAAAQTLAAWRVSASRDIATRWFLGAAVVALFLSLRIHGLSTPTGEWYAFGCSSVMAFAAAGFAVVSRRQRFAYWATLLAAWSAIYLWIPLSPFPTVEDYLRLLLWLILAVAVSSVGWLALEIRSQQVGAASFFAPNWAPASHQFFAFPCLLFFGCLTFVSLCAATIQRSQNVTVTLDATTVGSVATALAMALLFFGMLWDRRAKLALPGIFVWGLCMVLMLVDTLVLEILAAVTTSVFGIALCNTLASFVWRQGVVWAAWGNRRGISYPVAGLRSTARWLPPTNLILATLTGGLGLLIVLAFPERQLRFVAAAVPIVSAAGVAFLAQGNRRSGLRLVSLMLIALGAIFISWADIEPSFDNATWLDRVVRILMVLSVTSLGYSLIVARRVSADNLWYAPLRRAGLLTAGGAFVALAVILGLEASLYFLNPTRGAPLSDLQLVAVAVVLVALIAALITMALQPGGEGAERSDNFRKRLVYVAQLTGALLFAHLFFARPTWFALDLRLYWPYIVMAIAFAGAAAGELFRRAKLEVLGEPFQRTGAILPLIPALGMWIVVSRSDFSVLFFLAGMLYVFLSLTRKSTSNTIAAAIAGNASLWSLLIERQFRFWQSPQFWIIPPAVSVLVAAELNRKQLSNSALTSLRYGSLIVIYISSTGEMFLRGIGEQLWPAILLIALSLAGAFAGLVLRIRDFLFLGSAFTFLALISMVWHASRAIEHSWPWWAFGIGCGLAILTLFGFFEKHRDRVHAMVDDLK